MNKDEAREIRKLVTQERSCSGKRRYRSYWAAENVIERMDDTGLHSYWCQFCRGVHVGHPPKSNVDTTAKI
jgi:hypothetical protein